MTLVFVSNAPMFSSRPITGWIVAQVLELPGGKVAFLEPHVDPIGDGPEGPPLHLSVRGDDTLQWVEQLGANETFRRDGNLASCFIGEGPRVVSVVAAV